MKRFVKTLRGFDDDNRKSNACWFSFVSWTHVTYNKSEGLRGPPLEAIATNFSFSFISASEEAS